VGKLVKHIILFLFPLLAILLVLPVNKRFAYQGLKDDCFNHGLWIHDRIYLHPKEIDIAFLGSSRTLNSVDDKLISDSLAGVQAVNFGYCRFGRDLGFVLLKEIIRTKELKKLVIEVRANENRFSHPIFPYIADSRDVVLASPIMNGKILANAWTHFAYKIELTQDYLYRHETKAPVRTGDAGFAPVEGTAAPSDLEEIKQSRTIPGRRGLKIEQTLHAGFARVYLKRISKICSRKKIDIYFLYLPSYGIYPEKPKELKTYLKYGEVLIPPMELLEDQGNWYDVNHLNAIGANGLSVWIAKQLCISNQ
jgi:hypothetical protein